MAFQIMCFLVLKPRESTPLVSAFYQQITSRNLIEL